MKLTLWLKFMLFAALIIGLNIGVFSQNDFEEWKKQRQQQMNNFRADREKQMADLAKQFDNYVKEQDKAFADYLTERWRQFQAFRGIERPFEPKPDVIPVYEEPDTTPPPKPLPYITKPPLITPALKPVPTTPRVIKSEPVEFPVNIIEVGFYGSLLAFEVDQNIQGNLLDAIDEESISKQFEKLSNTNYNSLLEQIFEYRNQMNLNDWGYYQLVLKLAGGIAYQSVNDSRFLTWFLLLRSGYSTRLAYYENEIFLLLPIANQVYGRSFFTFNNQPYYLMEGETEQLFSYENDFPDARRLFDLNIYKALMMGEGSDSRNLSFIINDETHSMKISYNSHIIDFYSDYPQADIKVYLEAMISIELKNSLVESLAPLISGKSEPQAVSLLLRFVQTAFDYKTDQDQFGFEKFFFSDELFHYPYSDCEDRSVLFAYLVRSLTGLDVVGVKYPGHLATAVAFSEDVQGDFVMVNGRKFVIADPTFINAPIGMTMPQFANVEAEIIPLNSFYSHAKTKQEIWEGLITGGGNRGDNLSDIAFNQEGEALVAGYFTQNFNYKTIAESGNDDPSMFALLIDPNGQPVWFNKSSGKGKALAYTTLITSSGDALVAGTFSGEMKIGSYSVISENNADLFLANFDRRGNIQWLSRANLDTINQNNSLNFVAKFTSSGRHVGNELYFESAEFNAFGISTSADGQILITGAFNRNTGMNVVAASFAAGGEFDLSTMLKEENDRLVQQKYEKTIAGMFAAINLIKSSDISIHGVEVQQILDRYNPAFKKDFPNIYRVIGSILFIKNEDGIVTIRTESPKGLSIDMMQVNKDAKIKIVMLESGDARLDILSGVKVGKALWWYPLNYVLMYRSNGNLLFDYDTDNAQQVRNLKKDILY